MQSSALLEQFPGARSAPSECLIEAVALECARNDSILFTDLSFALAPGEVLHVSGPNGSGKTSLLRILCGLGLPEQGEVRWRGMEIRSMYAEFLGHVHYLGHSDGISLDLSCAENLEFARSLAAAPFRPVAAILEETGLSACAEMPARRLSTGQRRRLALAQLLLLPAELWLLDEPFTALDTGARALVNELIARHVAGGGAAIVASHETIEPGQHVVRQLAL